MKYLILIILSVTSIKVNAQILPNSDFENWSITPFDDFKSGNWHSSNSRTLTGKSIAAVFKVAGYNSPSAVRMETIISGTDTIIGEIENYPVGFPLSSKPDSIRGVFRYNLPANDTAVLRVSFTNSSGPGEVYYFKIKGTGSQQSFIPFSFAVSLSFTPYAAVIEATSSNPKRKDLAQHGSWLDLDNLEFVEAGIAQSIQGGDFENWYSDTYDRLTSWAAKEQWPGSVRRSTDSYSGTYAAKLTSNIIGFAELNVLMTPTRKNDVFTGYYKYGAQGGDTAYAIVFFLDSNQLCSSTSFTTQLLPTSGYTQFSVRIDSIPSDAVTMGLLVYITDQQSAATEVYFDKMSLEHDLSVTQVATRALYKLYPNPVADVVNIEINELLAGSATISIFDMMGRRVRMFNEIQPVNNSFSVSLKGLTAGQYMVKIESQRAIYDCMLLKQ